MIKAQRYSVKISRLASFVAFAGFSAWLSQSAQAQEVKIKITGIPEVVVPLTPTINGQGNFVYSGNKTVDEPVLPGVTLHHKVTWNFTVPGNNQGVAGETFFTSVLTAEIDPASVTPRDCVVKVMLPSVSYPNIALGGGGSIKLTTNIGGGLLTCSDLAASNELLSVIADGEWASLIQTCPFIMAGTGAGSSTFTIQPSVLAQTKTPFTVNETIGLQLNAKITSGDKVTVNFTGFSVAAPTCPGDFDFNGLIDPQDLGYLLGKWGQTGLGIDADLNHDLVVDNADLGLLLGSMGPCGE